MSETPSVAVVGVGNPTMGDDGLGERVVEVLREADLPPTVEVTHAGTTAFFALEALDGADRGIVVDAVSDGQSEPGAIHRYRLTDGSFEGDPPDVFMHDFSFSEALRAGREAYDVPDDVRVFGVEPADTTVGLELSEPVAASIPAVVEAVLTAIPGVDPEELAALDEPMVSTVRTDDTQRTTEMGR